jgi:hypothetical protein
LPPQLKYPNPTERRSTSSPLADPVHEARRLLGLASERDVDVRVLGGVAIALVIAPDEPLLPRSYQDIDLITERGNQRAVADLLREAGYEGDEEFNSFNSHRRLLFVDPEHKRQVDVFVGAFSMCHEIPLEGRLLAAEETLPVAELLLTKLQIFELNNKDLRDILSLLHHGPEDPDLGRVGECCAADWGLWRTSTMNAGRLAEALDDLDVSEQARLRLRARVELLSTTLEAAPKTRRWKLRARIGDRVRWYEDPEDLA